eukprot:CAMPEP_0206282656 /NCGR_PEP_ID=MMETSP0047_2-20121206/39801_1 /ASSEMBLY_ACC=CAM_ASM_000192 /TAXON_ID=195065 /ORGANISM="Chroomonas mesostigmatica_cf, Strain CCMP1168" /LENGTH=82 /DNA_ID=CAMNT_0053712945 /DNA_START=55 /DNA_END=300 /DNA_ORIENTATION=+
MSHSSPLPHSTGKGVPHSAQPARHGGAGDAGLMHTIPRAAHSGRDTTANLRTNALADPSPPHSTHSRTDAAAESESSEGSTH